MGTGIHGVPPPYGGGGGRKRKRKKKSFAVELITGFLAAVAVVLAVFALPYLFRLSPGDIMAFDDAAGFEKIDALMDGLRHKRDSGGAAFSSGRRTITFAYKNGRLTDVSGEGYDGESDSKWTRDLEEARRILDEWGLDG